MYCHYDVVPYLKRKTTPENDFQSNPAAVAGSKVHPVVAVLSPPIMINLKCCSLGHYLDFEDDIAIMLNGESKYPD